MATAQHFGPDKDKPPDGLDTGDESNVEEARPLRILVVEDEIDTADSFVRVLGQYNHLIHVEHNGPSALMAGLAFRPDVVLLDIGLPFMNGYEVARKMRERFWGRKVLIIATTSWDNEEDKQRSLLVGINHHMVKPIDFDALMKLMKSAPRGSPDE